MTTQNGTKSIRPTDTQLARWAIACKGVQPNSVILAYVMERYGRPISKFTVQNVKQEIRKNRGRLPDGEGKMVEKFAQAATNGIPPISDPESLPMCNGKVNRTELVRRLLKAKGPMTDKEIKSVIKTQYGISVTDGIIANVKTEIRHWQSRNMPISVSTVKGKTKQKKPLATKKRNSVANSVSGSTALTAKPPTHAEFIKMVRELIDAAGGKVEAVEVINLF